MDALLSDLVYELDFDHLVDLSYKRFVEGVQTIELMQQAGSEREKEEVALVALLDVQSDFDMHLHHHHEGGNTGCISDFRQALKAYVTKKNTQRKRYSSLL